MSHLSLVQQAHAALVEVIREGDYAIDATAGNGHDTCFLAQQVGPGGRVYGFDIQQAALDETWRRLKDEGLDARVSLYHAGHEVMAMVLPESVRGKIRAVMFNLGYLPGGDKQHTTSFTTTVAALEQACEMLMPGGVISVLAYTGHPGGREETEAVKAWSASLSPDYYNARIVIPQSDSGIAPEWILVSRR